LSASTEPHVYFGERAGRYDSEYDRRDLYGYALQSRMNAVVRLVGDGPGDILDAGMGPGRLCGELASHGWSVSGVDAADEMVALARRRLPEAADRLVCSPIERLPFSDASFDAVVATGVLEYADLKPALTELARVLRPGGSAVLSYANQRALYGLWKTRLFYPLVRRVKRFLRKPPLVLAAGPVGVSSERFPATLRDAGLELEAIAFASFAAVPSPLDGAFPGLTVGLGRRLERFGPLFARRFATQIVYSARKLSPADRSPERA
jgi:ubiquinone/menaquinone biosynthesis C-methylase UbiE